MGVFRRLFNDRGEEIPDPRPAAIDTGLKKPPTLQETIRRLVRDESFKAALDAGGMETFEEADDFDVGDDFDPASPYEEDFDPNVKFIGARVGEQRGMMVEERPLNDLHRQRLEELKQGKYAKNEKAEVKSDEPLPKM